MIICKNVSFAYDTDKMILKNVNMNLPEGQVGVLLGLNGCGKSTLLKCIGKKITSHTGKVITDNNCRYIKDLPSFCEDLTGNEYIEMLLTLGGNKNNDYVYSLIDSIGINQDLTRPIKEVSIYTRKVLILISSLCLDSKTIILDDPFSDLDRRSQKLVIKMIKILKEAGKTILVATNLLYFGFEVADELYVLHRGKVRHIKNIFNNALQYEKKIMPLLLK